MRKANEILDEQNSMGSLVELTSAFEGIASLRISQIRGQVLASQQYFADLWKIYTQLRVDELFHFGRYQTSGEVIKKELMILISSEGSFSGDIDKRLIEESLKAYSPAKNDIVVIGRHGRKQLADRGINVAHYFKSPEQDLNINTAPLVEEVKKYTSTTVYYERYESLIRQSIQRINLSIAVMESGSLVEKPDEVINESNYLFEPSTYAVVNHLENSMMQITLSQAILESKLAQYASRFKAMSFAHERAQESFGDLRTAYYRAKRQEKDERLKETVNSLRAVQL